MIKLSWIWMLVLSAQSQHSRLPLNPPWALWWPQNRRNLPAKWPTSLIYHLGADWVSLGSTPHFLVRKLSGRLSFKGRRWLPTTSYPFVFPTVQTHAGIGDDPQTSQPIGSLDGEGNLLPGPVYSDRLKSGVLSIRRVQPNTFTLRFLRTQVGNIQSTAVCITPAVAGRWCTTTRSFIFGIKQTDFR